MQKQLKTNKMTEKIYSNELTIQNDTTAILSEIVPAINLSMEVLINEGISKEHAIRVLQGNYSVIREDYTAKENAKLEAAKALLGDNLIFDIATEKIEKDGKAFIEKLKQQIKPIAWQMHQYFDFFEFKNDSWELKNDYKELIELKNSIILTDPIEIGKYKKYLKLVELLNELKGDGANLPQLMETMVKFNHASGEFSMNYKIFDKNNSVPNY